MKNIIIFIRNVFIHQIYQSLKLFLRDIYKYVPVSFLTFSITLSLHCVFMAYVWDFFEKAGIPTRMNENELNFSVILMCTTAIPMMVNHIVFSVFIIFSSKRIGIHAVRFSFMQQMKLGFWYYLVLSLLYLSNYWIEDYLYRENIHFASDNFSHLFHLIKAFFELFFILSQCFLINETINLRNAFKKTNMLVRRNLVYVCVASGVVMFLLHTHIYLADFMGYGDYLDIVLQNVSVSYSSGNIIAYLISIMIFVIVDFTNFILFPLIFVFINVLYHRLAASNQTKPVGSME